MFKLKFDELADYLQSIYNEKVTIQSVGELGKPELGMGKELKGFGYGEPIMLTFEVAGKCKKVVLETLRASEFGHDHFADRAQVLIWSHSAFNKLPRHAASVDVGAFTSSGSLISIGAAEEFFILTDFVEGQEYYLDLDRIKAGGELEELDLARAKALSDYLVEIHKVKWGTPGLYRRRIRDLIGHGECTMGLIDSYSPDWGFLPREELKRIELRCVEWRWKLKDKSHRLRQVHGDFHPWNVKFVEGCDFCVLDRSRGEWGEPADDLSAMSINYIFFSLQRFGELSGPFEELFLSFMDNYLDKTGDHEILAVIQPFYAWRGLVVASPIWYPHLSEKVRRKLFNFIENVLEIEKFDVRKVNGYLGG